ncbi:hypothetical protein TKK_0009604 [Trichogramma kaykai]
MQLPGGSRRSAGPVPKSKSARQQQQQAAAAGQANWLDADLISGKSGRISKKNRGRCRSGSQRAPKQDSSLGPIPRRKDRPTE